MAEANLATTGATRMATKAEVAYELVRAQVLRGDLVPGSVIQQAASLGSWGSVRRRCGRRCGG